MNIRAKLLGMLTAVLLAFLVLPQTIVAQAPRYDSFYAFGDSLADIGNVFLASQALGIDPAPPPSVSPHRTYFLGRFSNGPVAFEYLWQLLSGQAPGAPNGLKPFLAAPILGPTNAVDFAFGGTGTPYIDQTPGGLYAPGLKGQVELFHAALRGRRPSRRTLYAIVTGANDYRNDAFNQPMQPSEVVQNIADAVVRLYDIGARDVMVLNLPDLSLLPAFSGDPASAHYLTVIHNTLLAAALNAVSAQLPRLNLIQVDINQVLPLLPAAMDRTTPALDALFPVLPPPYPPGFHMSACLFIDPATCADVPTFDVGEQFMFWDIVHPTTAVHRVLGEYLYQSLLD
jgi:phospholipase/lecithinase/hemolysin